MSRIRKPGNRTEKAQLRTHKRGYEYWRSWNHDGEEILYVHRLLAVAKYGFDAVSDKHVHHKNKITWDNRFDNIEIKDEHEHIANHASEKGKVTPLEKIRMAEMYQNTEASYATLADHFERASSCVYNSVQEVIES